MLQTTYRAAAGAFTAICVVMQYWLLVRGETFAAMAASSVKFFSFFTILTNVLAAVALLLPLDRAAFRGRAVSKPAQCSHGYHRLHHHRRGGVLPAARGLSQRQGWPIFFEYMLHYVTPPLFVSTGWLFVDKRDIDWRVVLRLVVVSAGLPRSGR